ncbi:MAG TPA: ArgE/DapE family deacylase [Methanotrichaceae archaeon]|nr:ArgE/DapE family deacylase [Methanotrichaceae archaeon]
MPKICPDSNYLLDVLRDLIAFKTAAPPGNFYHEIVDYLIPIFKGMGFKTEKIVMPQEIFALRCEDKRLQGDRVNLRASLDVGAEKTLVIYTHLDVVPASDSWSTNPFVLTKKGDRVYGRGVSDSKGGVAGLIAALAAVMKSGKPKYNLSVLLTTDEEVGGYSGLCYLVDEGLVKGDYMLCMDGFSDDLVIGSNGIITWEIAVIGRSAHSGSSFLGVNAIEKSIPVMEALMALKEKIQSRRSSLHASSALSSVGLKNLQPMLNITMINAGIKENIVPDRCVMRGDRRVIPEETMEAAEEELERALQNLGPDMKIRFFPGYPPMYVNPDNRWITEVRETVERVTGYLPKLSGSQGSLDQAYATDKTNIPTCVYGVGRQIESNIHGDDENVRISDLESFARVMIALISA